MHRSSFPALISTALVTALILATFSLPASATSRSVTFCKDADVVRMVPSPSLPTSDSLSAIATAVGKLPDDVAALKKIHTKLLAVAFVAPNATLAGVYRDAATSVLKETTALVAASNEEAALLSSPKSSPVVLALAKDLVDAFSAAAAANTYLTVDRSLVTTACRGVA